MTDISFYHLTSTPMDRALPMLMIKILEMPGRALVVADSDEQLSQLNQTLWTYPQWAFIPHGTKDDGDPMDHPIYLSTVEENLNQADVLVLADGQMNTKTLDNYKKCLILFDGHDAAKVKAARESWKVLKDAGHSLKYFKQKDDGSWALEG